MDVRFNGRCRRPCPEYNGKKGKKGDRQTVAESLRRLGQAAKLRISDLERRPTVQKGVRQTVAEFLRRLGQAAKLRISDLERRPTVQKGDRQTVAESLRRLGFKQQSCESPTWKGGLPFKKGSKRGQANGSRVSPQTRIQAAKLRISDLERRPTVQKERSKRGQANGSRVSPQTRSSSKAANLRLGKAAYRSKRGQANGSRVSPQTRSSSKAANLRLGKAAYRSKRGQANGSRVSPQTRRFSRETLPRHGSQYNRYDGDSCPADARFSGSGTSLPQRDRPCHPNRSIQRTITAPSLRRRGSR